MYILKWVNLCALYFVPKSYSPQTKVTINLLQSSSSDVPKSTSYPPTSSRFVLSKSSTDSRIKYSEAYCISHSTFWCDTHPLSVRVKLPLDYVHWQVIVINPDWGRYTLKGVTLTTVSDIYWLFNMRKTLHTDGKMSSLYEQVSVEFLPPICWKVFFVYLCLTQVHEIVHLYSFWWTTFQ